MHMQTTTTQKPALAGHFGTSPREYLSLGQLSNSCDELSIKTVAIGRGSFGVGCCMKMSGKTADYEIMIDGHGSVILGKVEGGKRIKLCEGGSHLQATWDAILNAVKRSESQ
jgi:hypothetical protein